MRSKITSDLVIKLRVWLNHFSKMTQSLKWYADSFGFICLVLRYLRDFCLHLNIMEVNGISFVALTALKQ